MTLRMFFRRYWFLCLLIAVVPIAVLFPNGGKRIHSIGWVVPSLFALNLAVSGFTLDTTQLFRQASNFRAIFLTLCSTYVAAPAAAYVLAKLWCPVSSEGDSIDVMFLQAMMIMAAQAGTLASAIALTMVARGNQELALVLTLISNTITVFATPFVLEVTVGGDVQVDVAAMVGKMFQMVLFPVFVGQLARRLLWSHTREYAPTLRVIPQLVILAFVYVGFSKASERLGDDPKIAVLFLGACVCLHVFLLGWSYGGATLFGLESVTRTAVVYCGSQKTLPNGIYLWTTFFSSNPYGAVPLVLYHLSQLIIDTLILPIFERQNARSTSPPGTPPG